MHMGRRQNPPYHPGNRPSGRTASRGPHYTSYTVVRIVKPGLCTSGSLLRRVDFLVTSLPVLIPDVGLKGVVDAGPVG